MSDVDKSVGAPAAERAAHRAGGFDEELVTYPAPNPATWQELPPLPPVMQGHPFGADEDGRPIRHYKGTVVRAAVDQMQDFVSQRLNRELPASIDQAERESKLQQARDQALDQLVERLNAAIPDRAQHVSSRYLLDESNYYSYEFTVYAFYLAAEICGDPDFHFHRGMRSIASSVVILGRAFPLRQIYGMLPRFTAKLTNDDIRSISTTPTSAIIQLHSRTSLAKMPPALHEFFLLEVCQAYQGAYSFVPCAHSHLPMADVKERHCVMHGDAYCEWEFSWKSPPPAVNLLVWIGLAVTLGLAVYGWLRGAAWPVLAWLGVILPVSSAWLVARMQRIARERDQTENKLQEQREQAEIQYDHLEQAHAELQLSTLALKEKVSELTALHEIGLALSATLDLDALLERSLRAVKTHLAFDRVLILLVDEERRLLAHGRSIGGRPDEAEMISQMQFSLDDLNHFCVQIVYSGKPILVTDVNQLNDANAQPYLQAMGASAFLAVPLSTQGKVLGVLIVDNALTGKTIPQSAVELLLTVGSEIAAAVESLRLYTTLEQRVAERTSDLKESERRLADIIEFLPDATLVIDRQGRVIAWNRAIEAMTGIEAKDMLGQGDYAYAVPIYGKKRPILIDLVLLSDEQLEKEYAQIQRQGSLLLGEALAPVLKGKPAYLFAAASALRDSKGNIVGAIETIRDISDRKQVEEELQKAKAVAEAATQAKSSFLATMSHEIRTPMNAIIGMSGLLLDTQLKAEQRDFAETIRSSSDALLTIINDILDFSKIEAGKMDLEEQPFDLEECVETALDLMKVRAAEKGVELACEIECNVPAAIVGDVTRLRQILANLLSNAVKFTEQGEVVVSVQLSVNGEQSAAIGKGTNAIGSPVTIHFAVRDTGIGIPPDRLDRLFQAFSQVDSSTTRKYGGTGLGLAVSKRLCEMMGGVMWVESEGVPGKGSTFHFTIRATETEAIPVRSRLAGGHPELCGRSALIVDDNATNRRILTLQMQGWGMQARATGSPLEALEWLRRGERFDVSILDLQMSEMDGVELARQIQALPRTAEALPAGASEMPLILLSCLGDFGKEIPADLFTARLNKPIRASALFDELMGIFTGERAPVPTGVAPGPDVEMAERFPLRILLADDYVVNQKVALLLLGQMGYRADVAANGLEALQALERQPYDVILMDVQMPEMDGLEATRQICERWPKGERPWIIAMTANAMQGDREMCLTAGMDDYLSKPIRVEELVRALSLSQPLNPDQRPEFAEATAQRSSERSTTEMYEQVIDQEAFGKLMGSLGGDADFLNDLVEAYLTSSPGLFASMQQAIASEEAAALQRAAHSLKTGSASFGALVFAARCKELEELGKLGALDCAEEKFEALEAAYSEVVAALQTKVQTG